MFFIAGFSVWQFGYDGSYFAILIHGFNGMVYGICYAIYPLSFCLNIIQVKKQQ